MCKLRKFSQLWDRNKRGQPTLSVLAHLWKDDFFMSSAWFSGMQPDRTSAATKSSSMVLNSEDPGFRCHIEQS